MKKRSVIAPFVAAVFASILWGFAGIAAATERASTPCLSLFAADEFARDLDVDIRRYQDTGIGGTDALVGSVARVGVIQGKRGYIYTAERTSNDIDWYSLFASLKIGIEINAQGDPRLAIALLGHDLAYVFGVSHDGRNRLQIADAIETNYRSHEFDEYLLSRGKSPTKSVFYAKEFENIFDRLEYYLREFADRGAMPTEDPVREWNHFLHDAAFHRHFAAAAPALREKAQLLVRHQYEFWLFAKRYFERSLPADLAYLAKRALIYELSYRLDVIHARLMSTNMFLLIDIGQPEHPLVPGHFVSKSASAKAQNLSAEALGYVDELVNGFGIVRKWFVNRPQTDTPHYDTSGSSPRAILENILIPFLEGKRGLEEDYARYLFGDADVAASLTRLNTYEGNVSVWMAALTAYQLTLPRNAKFLKPLFANEAELKHIARTTAARRSELMQAAKDYRAQSQSE